MDCNPRISKEKIDNKVIQVITNIIPNSPDDGSFEPKRYIIVFNWNHFEMRLLNLRINFYLLRTFCPHLGSFCVVSSFTTSAINKN